MERQRRSSLRVGDLSGGGLAAAPRAETTDALAAASGITNDAVLSRLVQLRRAYVQGLCERLAPAERTQLKEELFRGTRSTAQAAGGFLGVGRVSAAEQQMIDTLAASSG